MTETSMTKATTLMANAEKSQVKLTMINGTGAALNAGQEVYISGNNTVSKRTLGSQIFFGIVVVGGADGALVTISTVIQTTLVAHAKGGTINAGALVKPNGTFNADGTPEYVAAAPALGDYISAIVISGGNVDTLIKLGIFRTPVAQWAAS